MPRFRRNYDCDDPAGHLHALAAAEGLGDLPGVGMMTAADVRRVCRTSVDGVGVDATVGVTEPLWAAVDADAVDAVDDADDRVASSPGTINPGTINMVVFVPQRLSDGALVNAVMTATEAKSQALWESGLAGTGTATDAVCILCPLHGEAEAYGGPRSLWGSRLARAVHRAVLAGCADIAPAETEAESESL